MIHQQRVIYGDTDMMGVVYYANYLRYFEAARSTWFREVIGRSYRDFEALGLGSPVAEATCRHRQPSYYEDVLEVDARVTELKRASLRFDYLVARDGAEIARGHTVHVCVGPKGRPTRLPSELRDAIEVEPAP